MTPGNRDCKQWCLTKHETVISFERWKENLTNTLSMDWNFAPFLDKSVTWLRRTKGQPLRGIVSDVAPIPENQRKTAEQKVIVLELMLGQIANYCPIISRGTIVKYSTSISFIWQSIRLHFGFHTTTNKNAHFLNRTTESILNPGEHLDILFQNEPPYSESQHTTENVLDRAEMLLEPKRQFQGPATLERGGRKKKLHQATDVSLTGDEEPQPQYPSGPPYSITKSTQCAVQAEGTSPSHTGQTRGTIIRRALAVQEVNLSPDVPEPVPVVVEPHTDQVDVFQVRAHHGKSTEGFSASASATGKYVRASTDFTVAVVHSVLREVDVIGQSDKVRLPSTSRSTCVITDHVECPNIRRSHDHDQCTQGKRPYTEIYGVERYDATGNLWSLSRDELPIHRRKEPPPSTDPCAIQDGRKEPLRRGDGTPRPRMGTRPLIDGPPHQGLLTRLQLPVAETPDPRHRSACEHESVRLPTKGLPSPPLPSRSTWHRKRPPEFSITIAYNVTH